MGIVNNFLKKASDINASGQEKVIGAEQVREACEILKKYKAGKASLEARVIEDEKFFKLQHWDYLKSKQENEKNKKAMKKPSTAWMLNSVINKHADIMDNYPEANCLPREKQDEQDAKTLSEIIPVILEYNNYESTYSDNAWYYIKHGVSCQGAFWDSSKENGLGDIAIKNIDILNLFWEPGIRDIQDSANLFYVSLIDDKALETAYPNISKNKLKSKAITVSEYIYDDSIDNSDKSVVVDWYYKKCDETGRTKLHYVKFIGDTVLFASENEPLNYPDGYYSHGKYPFSIATMYPEAGTPYGFGIISVCRDPQLFIDTLDGLMLEHAYKQANPRFWVKKTAGINKNDFLDWNNPLVEVEGDIDEERVRQITLQSMGSALQNLRQMKVEELKETSSNRDFSQGSTASGVTSGAAIATLQEAGNKTTRDMLKSLYRSYVEIVQLVIELIRQFYDEQREFRIMGAGGGYEFVKYTNQNIKEQQISDEQNNKLFRRPVFDIDVKAQKSNPYSKMSQNETAINLYKLGIFNPQNAQPALAMLEIMDFEGKESVKEHIMQGQTLMNIINQQNQQITQMQAAIANMTEQAAMSENPDINTEETFIRDTDTNVQNPQSIAINNAKKLRQKSYAQTLMQKGGDI